MGGRECSAGIAETIDSLPALPCYRAKQRMSHWKLTLAYDGTPFHGWQVQPGLPTVQGVLSDAIHRVLGERVLPQGSGRTDTGVHALGQVASFSLEAPIPPDRLLRALNRCLPAAIRVLTAELADPAFHARHSALRKTYEYRIFPLYESQAIARRDATVAICPPTLAPFVWPCPWALSLDALNRAATHVIGSHDVTSFAAADPDLAGRSRAQDEGSQESGQNEERLAPVRTIFASEWNADGNLLIYRVTATGFLHHMVRNLVGTFVLCGSGRLSPDAIPAILEARSRSAAGPTAPPTGLFLVNVEYPADPQTRGPEDGA